MSRFLGCLDTQLECDCDSDPGSWGHTDQWALLTLLHYVNVIRANESDRDEYDQETDGNHDDRIRAPGLDAA